MNSFIIQVAPLKIPFNISFDHNSHSRSETSTVLVKITRGDNYGLGEGCPRPYVTGETVDSAITWIEGIKPIVEVKCTSLKEIYRFLKDYKEDIDKNPSAWCAVETAILDLFGKEQNKSIEELLGLKSVWGEYQYTAVVGDGNREKLNRYFDLYSEFGFWDYKIKICGKKERDKRKIDLFRKKVLDRFPKKGRLRIDANNLWDDYNKAFSYLRDLNYPFLGIEEPLLKGEPEKLSNLSRDLKTPVILDESLCNLEDLGLFSSLRGEFIANIRVSKMGGLLRALEMVSRVKDLNWGIIIGSLVGETSILTRLALTLAKVSGKNLLAQEGAFGTLLLSREIVKPVLMFGKGGVLKFQKQQNTLPGLGIIGDEDLIK
jgi:L-alanine-DL-glutamate epimerase-like enolase superfamily enzyme